MQNQEADEVYGKLARFVLFTEDNKQFNEGVIRDIATEAKKESVGFGSSYSYYVLWYDPKMKNYEIFIDYLVRKRLVQCDIVPLLVVDKPIHQKKVSEIWDSRTDDPTLKETTATKNKLTFGSGVSEDGTPSSQKIHAREKY